MKIANISDSDLLEILRDKAVYSQIVNLESRNKEESDIAYAYMLREKRSISTYWKGTSAVTSNCSGAAIELLTNLSKSDRTTAEFNSGIDKLQSALIDNWLSFGPELQSCILEMDSKNLMYDSFCQFFVRSDLSHIHMPIKKLIMLQSDYEDRIMTHYFTQHVT